MANATFEALFNLSVLDVIVPVATAGLPRPPPDNPYVDDEWLDVLSEEATDRKLAFFDENLDILLTIRAEYEYTDTDDQSRTPPANLLAFLAHLQITYDASYIASLPADAPIVPVRTTSMKGSAKAQTTQSLLALHPSIFPPSTPNPVPSSGHADKQYVQVQGTPLRTGAWGDGMDSGPGEEFALLWSASESCWIAIFKMTVQVSFMTTTVQDPLLCLTVSSTLREKPLAITSARKPLQALLDAAGGLPTPVLASSPTRLNGEDDDEYKQIDITGLDEVNLLDGLTLGSAALKLPTTRLGASVRKAVFGLPDLAMEPPTPLTDSSAITISRANTVHGSHVTLRKSFRKTLRTISGFRVRMRTVFVPYFMLPQNSSKIRKGRNASRRKSTLDFNPPEDSDSDSDAAVVHERELRVAGSEEHTVILCVEIENAQDSSPSVTSPLGFSVETVDVSVSGEGAQTRLIAWGDAGLSEPERVFPLFIKPSEQYNLLYAVSFLRSPEKDDQFSLARGRGLPGAPGGPIQDLQRAVGIVINGRPYEIPLINGEAIESDSRPLDYPTSKFPSRWNCVLDLSSNVVSANLLGNAPNNDLGTRPGQNKREVLPTPASPFPSSGPRTSIIGPAGSGGGGGGRTVSPHPAGQRPGTATPTMVAGSKRHTLGAMDELFAGGAKPPPSPVNYRSGTAMLNPANLRDTHLQTGTQQNVINAAATAAAHAQAMQNPILGPNSASTRSTYLPPSMAVQTYAKSPTTYGPLSPPLPPTPGGGIDRSFAGAVPQFQYRHGADDSISSFISTDSSSTFTMVVPPTPAYPAYPASPMSVPMSPTARRQKYWQAPIGGGQGGVSVGPSVEIRREKAMGVGIPQTPGPRVGPGLETAVGAPGGFAQMQNDVLGGGPQNGEGEPIVVSVGLLPLPKRKFAGRGSVEVEEKIYPLDQFTLDIFVFNRSSWTRRFEVSYPDRRRRRREQANIIATLGIDVSLKEDEDVGIVPLENRVRIGPLLPSTCQSVRMDFLALLPGVHAIDTLTLTDIQSGFTMDLRSVIDVVVHEHEIPLESVTV
ncbi:hypothetical protein EUX98_g2797 [Antrodiella citrinella]|uniref:Trafficking protein particle complex II-specific subunit 65 IgD3 domain-containing protein n=1 Tax=Antrodiella citrinella TaxID=2447956 RepID=A0A4S4N0X8_9APHY|nr:hypothetical protein EUX98_g2797 [Antrodiella citrinella]